MKLNAITATKLKVSTYSGQTPLIFQHKPVVKSTPNVQFQGMPQMPKILRVGLPLLYRLYPSAIRKKEEAELLRDDLDSDKWYIGNRMPALYADNDTIIEDPKGGLAFEEHDSEEIKSLSNDSDWANKEQESGLAFEAPPLKEAKSQKGIEPSLVLAYQHFHPLFEKPLALWYGITHRFRFSRLRKQTRGGGYDYHRSSLEQKYAMLHQALEFSHPTRNYDDILDTLYTLGNVCCQRGQIAMDKETHKNPYAGHFVPEARQLWEEAQKHFSRILTIESLQNPSNCRPFERTQATLGQAQAQLLLKYNLDLVESNLFRAQKLIKALIKEQHAEKYQLIGLLSENNNALGDLFVEKQQFEKAYKHYKRAKYYYKKRYGIGQSPKSIELASKLADTLLVLYESEFNNPKKRARYYVELKQNLKISILEGVHKLQFDKKDDTLKKAVERACEVLRQMNQHDYAEHVKNEMQQVAKASKVEIASLDKAFQAWLDEKTQDGSKYSQT